YETRPIGDRHSLVIEPTNAAVGRVVDAVACAASPELHATALVGCTEGPVAPVDDVHVLASATGAADRILEQHANPARAVVTSNEPAAHDRVGAAVAVDVVLGPSDVPLVDAREVFKDRCDALVELDHLAAWEGPPEILAGDEADVDAIRS